MPLVCAQDLTEADSVIREPAPDGDVGDEPEKRGVRVSEPGDNSVGVWPVQMALPDR
jgi:hypothetical protein